MEGRTTIKWLIFCGVIMAFGTASAQHSGDLVAVNNETETEEVRTTAAKDVFGPVYHKVAPGETIQSIITEFGMNHYQFSTWNSISGEVKPGMNVIIKFKWSKANETVNSSQPALKAADGNFKLHKVGPKETLFNIAKMYNVTVKQLEDWNSLNGCKIKIGQSLKVGS